jgi:hypothetical protein
MMGKAHGFLPVIDLLSHPAVPTEILSHPIIALSLSKIWRYGAAQPDPFGTGLPLFRKLLALYDSTSAPR